MRIVDEKTLTRFRGRGFCDFCTSWCETREAAHLIARGMGSGKRLDVDENLLSLGAAFDCGCHTASHNNGKPTQQDLLACKADLLGCTVDDLEPALRGVLKYDPKDNGPWKQALYAGLPTRRARSIYLGILNRYGHELETR